MMVAVEAHLKDCGACAGDVAALRQTWVALDSLPMVEPPPDFAWRVTTRIQRERLERQENERRRSGFWQRWTRALTPAHAVGFAAIAALLAVGLVYPLRLNTPQVTFGPLGRVDPNAPVTTPQLPPPQSDPTLAPRLVVEPVRFESGQWMGSVRLTAAAELPQFTVSARPMSLVGDRLVGAEWLDLAAGTMRAGVPYTIPIALGAEDAEVRAVELRITSPALPQQIRKVIYFPFPGGAVPRALVSLEASETNVYVLLSRLAGTTQRPIVADTGLRGSLPLRLRNATPEQVLNEIVVPLGYHWSPIPGGYTVTSR
jgi:hypothetical protein